MVALDFEGGDEEVPFLVPVVDDIEVEVDLGTHRVSVSA